MFTLRSILTLWNAVFFSSVDPTPIALFRVAIGGLILVNTGLLWPRRELYFGTNGMLDLTTWRERAASHVFSLCKWIPPSVVLGVHGIAGGFVAVGWGTSISLFIAWITMIS
ncbi:hypothetical protein EBR96_09110, partial [bacterium]|nr:hypothetical protein [bacterium]